MKQFLKAEEKERQQKRADLIEELTRQYVEMLDWEEGLKRSTLVKTADFIIKLIKKTKKTWLRGGFIDEYELGHEEPSEEDQIVEPVIERELDLGEKFPPLERPKTRHLEEKGQKHANTFIGKKKAK